jgi:para-nitrobenzyl esterase
MKHTISFLILFVAIQLSFSQAQGCTTTRYITDVTPSIKKTLVTYGSAVNQLGFKDDLQMNIYTPENDVATKRPMIMFVHGGSFFAGARSDMDSLCATYARKGYVTCTPDYRLFPLALGFPDSVQIVRASIEAMHDTKAALRYMKKDAATTNLYKVDVDNIVIGGISAGAIIALHIGMLDSTDVIPSKFLNTLQTLGGFDGKTGNPGYQTDVVGVINMSGALFDISFIDANDPPFASIHGSADLIVPIGYGSRSGGVALLYGSDQIVAKANTVKIPNIYTRIVGGGHTDIYTDAKFKTQLDDYLVKTTVFTRKIVCKEPLTTPIVCACDSDFSISIFPNPTESRFAFNAIKYDYINDVEIFDMSGKLMKKYNGINILDYQEFDLNNGTYIVRVLKPNTNIEVTTKQLVVQKR